MDEISRDSVLWEILLVTSVNILKYLTVISECYSYVNSYQFKILTISIIAFEVKHSYLYTSNFSTQTYIF